MKVRRVFGLIMSGRSTSVLLIALLAHVAGQNGGDCDVCGASATYSETVSISNNGVDEVRKISSTGCPNHYNYCTGKGLGVCGNIGEEGTGTEASDLSKSVNIPAYPVFATEVNYVKCELGAIAIALNGVSIYSGAVDSACTTLDVDDNEAEWTSFDFCGGHADLTGD